MYHISGLIIIMFALSIVDPGFFPGQVKPKISNGCLLLLH